MGRLTKWKCHFILLILIISIEIYFYIIYVFQHWICLEYVYDKYKKMYLIRKKDSQINTCKVQNKLQYSNNEISNLHFVKPSYLHKNILIN